jgi:hypothetical protein
MAELHHESGLGEVVLVETERPETEVGEREDQATA